MSCYLICLQAFHVVCWALLVTNFNKLTISIDFYIGEPATVKLTIRPAENYPVDLYYLMVMSASMSDDLDKLRALAGTIG